jgi:hypothetical protein
MDMKNYQQESRYNMYDNEPVVLEEAVGKSMWGLFQAIGRHWAKKDSPDEWRSSLLVFMQNRMMLNETYERYYVNAMNVIDELTLELGNQEKAYEFLFTNPAANIAPPTTKLAFARQLVSNEFITLYLALGGFETFGGAKNYMGYFGGANIPGDPPYRTIKK